MTEAEELALALRAENERLHADTEILADGLDQA